MKKIKNILTFDGLPAFGFIYAALFLLLLMVLEHNKLITMTSIQVAGCFIFGIIFMLVGFQTSVKDENGDWVDYRVLKKRKEENK